MLDIQFIRENLDEVKKNIENRKMIVDVDRLLELDDLRRDTMTQLETLRASRNKGSKSKPTDEQIQKMREVGSQIKQLEGSLTKTLEEYKPLLLAVPNMAHPDAPVGEEKDFTVLETVGEKPAAGKNHEELMTELDLLDFERGAKVVGSKFYFSKGDLVRLNMALLQYGMDVAEKHGFHLIETPDVAKQDIMEGIGFNPRGEESQVYTIEGTDLGLIGTAEITIGGYHANETLDLSDGPVRYAALSHCFRQEAGAYGRTSKGLYRVHQFTKLEMFVYCAPEDAEAEHEKLLTIEKEICDGLELAYRVIDTPTGDLGAPAYRKYDIEAWMHMVGEDGGYGEITSTSNCTDYQARRLKIRYQKNGKKGLAHTLNGTAIVLSRFPVALFEQHQQPDGSVRIPKALQPYFGRESIGKHD